MSKLATVYLYGDNEMYADVYEDVVPVSITKAQDGRLLFSTEEKNVETNLKYIIEIPKEF
ncbi:MAG: hypothetical protein WBL19_00840 [Minisyncoccia bacterium]